MAAIALAPSAAPVGTRLLARRVPAAMLLGAVIGWLALDQLLLGRFLGLAGPVVAAGWAALTGGLFWLMTLPRRRDLHDGPALGTLLACLAAGCTLMLLGGEGRFFYANIDWQVRDAVLRDMAIHPWPFVYASGDLLRAPVGMYLVPALAGKLWGQHGADIALLAQNGLLTGLLLAIGSTLFAGRRQRLIALAVLLAFGGLDILGQIKAGHAAALAPTAHLEGWGPTQFSSTITLAFWVPQHALAGWLGALAFLLWRVGRMELGMLLAIAPLTALWSPLAAIGLMPFVLHAAWHDARRHRIAAADLALPLVATLIALPGLAYLAAAGDEVGLRPFPIAPAVYLLFLSIELLPFLLVVRTGREARFGGAVFTIATPFLLLCPLIQIGWSIDFAMRASIPALTILTVHIADMLADGGRMSVRRRAVLVLLLAVGSLTGLAEIARAVAFPASPVPRCGLSRAWDESFAAWPKASYLAPLGKVPAAIRPASPARAAPEGAGDCFDRPWPKPALF